MNLATKPIAVMVALASFGSGSSACFALSQYVLTDLGSLYDAVEIVPNSINENGEIVGSEYSRAGEGPLYNHGFLYANGTISQLPPLIGFNSIPYGINDAGQICGSYTTTRGWRGFFYDANGFSEIGTLPGGYDSFAYGLNAAGRVVGEGDISPFPHAFLYSDGTLTDLGAFGGAFSIARAINDVGQITGTYRGSTGLHAYLYTNGVRRDLGVLPGDDRSIGLSVNRVGVVCGVSTKPNDLGVALLNHAFVFVGSQMANLGTLGGTSSQANGINDAGDVCGYSTIPSGESHAFLYTGDTMLDLNALLAPGSGWILSNATALNDRGQIVGTGIDPSGHNRAFLLTPLVPEPHPLLLFTLGSLALVVRTRRPEGSV